MGISQLSINDKNRLLQLSESLKEIVDKKEELVKKIEPYYNRMTEIEEEINKLDNKYEKLMVNKDSDNFTSSLDADELANIILKTNELDSEKNNIIRISDGLYDEFNEILKQEDEISLKMKEIVSSSIKVEQEEKNNGINIDNIGLIYIRKPSVLESEVINKNLDEIIRCDMKICNKISDVFSKNEMPEPVVEEENKFEKLSKLYLENKEEEKQEIEENLMFVQKTNSDESIIENISQPINIDIPVSNTPVMEESIYVENVEEPTPAKTENEDKAIIDLNTILMPTEPINSEPVINDPSVVYINNALSFEHAKIANSNTTKLKNIIKNFGKISKSTIIKNNISQNNNVLDIQNFIGVNKTA